MTPALCISDPKYQALSGRARLDAYLADKAAARGLTVEAYRAESERQTPRVYTDF